MSIKYKVLLVVFSILGLGVLADYAIFDAIIFEGFLRLEETDALRDMERCKAALDSEILHLDIATHNISSSDLTYRFMQRRERQLQHAFFSWESASAAQVNLSAMYDEAGQLVQCSIFDLQTREQLRLRDFDRDKSLSASPLRKEPFQFAPVRGIVLTEAGPMLVAARPILNTQGWGPPRGVLVFGRLLNQTLLDQLRDTLNLDFKLRSYAEIDREEDEDVRLAQRQVIGVKEVRAVTHNEDTLHVLSTYPDVAGAPALLLRVDYPRKVTQMGRSILHFALLAVIVLSCLLVAALSFFLERMVAAPLERFAAHLSSQPEHQSEPFKLDRKDEIGAMIASVNAVFEQRRQAMEELHKTQALQRAMLDNIPLDFWARDREQRCIMQSDISREYWGDQLGQAMNAGDVDPDTLEKWRRNNELVLSGRTLKHEVEMVPMSGERVLFNEIVAPIMDQGEIKGILGVNIDITETRRREAELGRAKDAAEAASKAKNEFLANMSHEIRTPLNGIFGMLQLIRLAKPAAPIDEYIEHALDSGKNLLRIINDILDFSKIEAGKIDLVENSFDLAETVREVNAIFATEAARKGVELSAALGRLPARKFIGDEGRLRQVLFNLVGNAVKFTPSGRIEVTVNSLHCDLAKNCRLHCTVSDTGVGIPEEKIRAIFEPFIQADGSFTKRFSGTGLGLSIVKRLVGLMGGDIRVSSTPGQGASFSFDILLRIAPESQPAQPEIAEPATTSSSSGALGLFGMRVLLVEDELVNQYAAKRFLDDLGCTTDCAGNGEEAIAALRKKPYDAILMDVQMPVLDGVLATQKIRASTELGDRARTPIIAMTAYAMQGDRERFLAVGMNEYLSKPLEFAALTVALERVSR
jgi:signal transduction histidine kinase/sensor domain CHASE-containing protein